MTIRTHWLHVDCAVSVVCATVKASISRANSFANFACLYRLECGLSVYLSGRVIAYIKGDECRSHLAGSTYILSSVGFLVQC